MEWIDIACIVFSCVTANHLGLIEAIASVTKCRLPILGCVKCLTFWCTLVYGLSCSGFNMVVIVLAISFLASYIAIWLELLEAFVDKLYMKLYGKIATEHTDNTDSSDAECVATTSILPEL